MMEPLVVACPGFVADRERFVEEWSTEPGPMPQYLLLADLARYLIGLVARNEFEEIGAAFEVVERWYLEGDDYVSEAATIGLLESLQNSNLHETTEPDSFRRFLGPETERWWDKVERFWSHGDIIRDD